MCTDIGDYCPHRRTGDRANDKRRKRTDDDCEYTRIRAAHFQENPSKGEP